jgi:hypothetical protein
VEAYVDDVVVKTTMQDQLITDLAETFSNLHTYQWKLNPTKCVFDVPSGLLLGFMVGHRGIEANPVKVDRNTQHGQTILQEGRHEAHGYDGRPRSFHQQARKKVTPSSSY